MARLGLLGFANVGKTTLFNALTGLDAVTASHPFSTREPNIGVARVPDRRLEEAARVEGSAKVVPATLDLLDLPALARGGVGLVGPFMGRLREMDALIVVLRTFGDPSVPDDESGRDPVAQAEEITLELTVADLEVFERKGERLAKEAAAEPGKRRQADAVAAATLLLSAGTPLRANRWSEEERMAFRDMAPLTLKPTVWAINVDDTETSPSVAGVESVVPRGDTVVAVSAKIEEEASRLLAEEREEVLAALGLGEGALATMVRAVYTTLGLISFFTIGPKEAHAWTVEFGATAPRAAGKIHSDLERGFIRAEVAAIGEVIEAGGWEAAKKAGHMRVEGKGYVVNEGDVLLVRFSV